MLYIIIISLELLFLFFLSKQLTRSLSLFLYTLKFNQTACTIIIAILFLPGTVIHELAHLLMAHLLFVPTGAISLLPKLEGSSIRMGSVVVAKTDRFRSLLIGVAPFVVGLTILFFSFVLFLPNLHSFNYWLIILFVYVLFVMTNSMFSSKRDLEGAGLLGIVCILAIGSLYIFDIHLLSQLQILLSIVPQSSLLTAIDYLAIPIALDIGSIIVLRLLIRIF